MANAGTVKMVVVGRKVRNGRSVLRPLRVAELQEGTSARSHWNASAYPNHPCQTSEEKSRILGI